jgi:hypothetical protein
MKTTTNRIRLADFGYTMPTRAEQAARTEDLPVVVHAYNGGLLRPLRFGRRQGRAV